MQFLLLIYENEAAARATSEAEQHAVYAGYMTFTADLKASGKLISGDALQGIDTATTLRIRDGKTTVTDGPFAETKEQLGGYYLVEATDLDDALAIAARLPTAKTGSIEVRPVMVFG